MAFKVERLRSAPRRTCEPSSCHTALPRARLTRPCCPKVCPCVSGARVSKHRVSAILKPKPDPQKSAVGDIPIYTSLDRPAKTDRPRVVILGSGWGAMSLVKALPANVKDSYDVVVVSPRNYFLYTPLLPAVATGTCEDRSIVQPVRNLVVGKGTYYEAVCQSIDVKSKQLVACFPEDAGLDKACFKIDYDVLVVAVGSVNNTFGIKGVKEHCFYFKSIEDAMALRRRISECFERAALPQTPEEERKRLLSFVIVGGGPTGVEVAAELYDMVNEDLVDLYPGLTKDVKIQIVELQDHVLSTYDRAISKYTGKQFERAGIKLVLNSRVQAVTPRNVEVINKAGEVTELPFGACVWATGIAMNPLIRQLQEQIPGQKHFRSILTDDTLCVKGSGGSIYALGDAATIDEPKALEEAEELFELADIDKNGELSMVEFLALLQTASKKYPQMSEHVQYVKRKLKPGKVVGDNILQEILGRPAASNGNGAAQLAVDATTVLSREQFREVLSKIDSGLRALPATAQVAAQQGKYLAKTLTSAKVTGEGAVALAPAPFKYFHKGSLAYIGRDQAVADVPRVGALFGLYVGFLWKGYETLAQFSFRNQVLVANDWLRTKLFGRDISRF